MEKIEQLISGLRKSGYDVILFFLWLPSAEMAVARVASRVRQGGHDVPAATIRRRFQAGLRNLFQLYAPLVNSWYLLDRSSRAKKRDSLGALSTCVGCVFPFLATS
jgi:predicted ABC-type ATPase